MITKVAAYVVSRSRRQLLVFAHRDHPDVPLQVPGGTLEAGESPVDCAVRELEEEAGLIGLPVTRFLGSIRSFRRSDDALVERHYFLFHAPDSLPTSWEHRVLGSGEDCGLYFSYSWRSPAELELAGDLGFMLHADIVPELYEAR